MMAIPIFQITLDIPKIPNVWIGDGEFADEYVGRLFEFNNGTFGLILSVFRHHLSGRPANIIVTFAGRPTSRLHTTMDSLIAGLV